MHLLSATSGGADIVAFLQFHMVFTSAMTGNLALFGIAVGQGHLLSATHSLAALIGFIVGIMLATLWKDHPQALRMVLGLEVTFLGLYALLWIVWGFPADGAVLYALIVFSALSMGLQSVAARLINVAGVPSVVFTNTLTTIVITLVESLRKKQSLPFAWHQQVAALFAYLTGAIVFAFFLFQLPALAMILPVCLVSIALSTHWAGTISP
ncbi:YoaK family protein [Acidithiobacillus sp. M4-SHS-6]|uniref:YoaK family protein n=1 Tax=Acidithiobacillus sp. M4-SHS-6 TaxID=3383024 RepID=UPI0039BE5E3C